MNRFGAFSIHLGISLVIFVGLAALVVYVWYPDFFFTTDGGWQGIRIIALVDIVLGPLLTLVVFDRRKPELKRDLTIIGVIQVTCLAAGTFVVYSERPLALVYVDGQFQSMSADSYTEMGLAVPDLSALPGPYPKRVVVDIPEDPIEQSQVRRGAMAQRISLTGLSDRYVPMTYERLAVSREGFDVEELATLDAESGTLTAWLSEHGGSLSDYSFFPYGARYDFVFLAVSRKSRQIVGMLDIPRLGRAPEPQRAS
jgi:hypothetical protein